MEHLVSEPRGLCKLMMKNQIFTEVFLDTRHSLSKDKIYLIDFSTHFHKTSSIDFESGITPIEILTEMEYADY